MLAFQDVPKISISIHAPRTGSDVITRLMPYSVEKFQSTLPARGATWMVLWMLFTLQFQSTLPARGATTDLPLLFPRRGFQSTLPARGATRKAHGIAYRVTFQSTLPARGATLNGLQPKTFVAISIHAPRTGSDVSKVTSTKKPFLFQSTLPARGATTYA